MRKSGGEDFLALKGGEPGPQFPIFRFSSASRYALSATSYLAQRPSRYCAIEEIAARKGLPRSFLVKVLRHLARRGITNVQRGPGGGHMLARPANEISLAEIVEVVEMPLAGERSCLLELHGCGTASPCALHEEVRLAEQQVWRALRAVKLDSYSIRAPAGAGTRD